MKKIFKRLTAALLMLSMVFGLAACSMGGPKDDKAFFKNLRAGLEVRWKLSEKHEVGGPYGMAEQRSNMKECANCELEKIGVLSEYQFADEDLKALAEQYVEALNDQVSGAKYLENDDVKFNELYGGGYNKRCSILYTLVNDYQFTVSSKYIDTLDEMTIAGETYQNVQGALDALTEALPALELNHASTGLYNMTMKNPCELSLDAVSIDVKGMDEDGNEVGKGQTFLMDWKSGDTLKEDIYTDNDFKKAAVRISFTYDLQDYATDYVEVTVKDDLVVNMELPQLPLEVTSYGIWSRKDVACTLEAVNYTAENWYDGHCTLSFKLTGTKTFDRKGDDKVNAARIGWKLYDSTGAVVDSGTCYASECMVGEQFKNSEFSAYNIVPGDYRLEIFDDKWD